MKTVNVAAGIICGDNDEVLAAQRGYGEMSGLWEFPGGKVERGESHEDACVRELSEELHVTVCDLRDFYTVEFDYPDFHLSMRCFFCRIAEGEPDPEKSDRQLALKWIPRKSLAKLTWMPADVELVKALVEDAEREEADKAADKERETPTGEKEAPESARKTARTRRRERAKAESEDAESGEGSQLVRRRAAIRKSMQGNKRADTKPEMLVRRRLREAGLTGYRLQWKKAPGRPDIAFPGRKIAIFVNGCFWHRCPKCKPSVPKRNVEFWEAKFSRNVARDAAACAELERLGWTVITIWECDLKRDRIDETMSEVVEKIRAVPAPKR